MPSPSSSPSFSSSSSSSSLHQPLLPNSSSGADNNTCLLHHRHPDHRDRDLHHDHNSSATATSSAAYHHFNASEDLERDGRRRRRRRRHDEHNNNNNNGNGNDNNSSDYDESNINNDHNIRSNNFLMDDDDNLDNDDDDDDDDDGDDQNSIKSWLLVVVTTLVGPLVDICSGSGSSSSSRSRFILIFVSFLFATFNISARAVYSFDDAPSPSVFSTIRGYMVVIFFVPLLINKQRRQQRTQQQQQQQQEQQDEEERQEELSKNNMVLDTVATITTTTTTLTSRELVGEDGDENDVEERNSILPLLLTLEKTRQQQDEDDDQKADMTNDDTNDDVDENYRSNRMVGLPPPSPPPRQLSWPWPSLFSMWIPALELSVWNFVSQACYNVGIRSVSSSARASFLGQSSVIMTPFIVVVCSRLQSFITKSPRRNGDQQQQQQQHDVSVATWTGCFIAMVGLSFLSSTPTTDTTTDTTSNTTLNMYPTVPTDDWDANTTVISFTISKLMDSDIEEEEDGEDMLGDSLLHRITLSLSSPSPKVTLSFGDSMILLSSFTWSFYIIRTCSHSTKYDEVYLQGLKNMFNALLYTAWWLLDSNFGRNCLWSGWNGSMAVASWSIMIYSAFGPGCLADVLQQTAQGSVPASEANVILSMEPIFTAALGFTLLHEKLTRNECLGGCFLVLGSLVASSMATGPIQTLSPEH